MEYKILIVDDEPDIIEFIGYNLKKEGFHVSTATNGKEAVEIAMKVKPHLVLLDIMMPVMDGIEACEEIRKNPELNKTIIAFLTARNEDYSQIAGFEAGADDYIAKPIKPKVLISRIKALLKRQGGVSITETENRIKIGNIEIDKEKYYLIMEGEKIILPRREFDLLLFLISKPDKVFTREEIYNHIWGTRIIVGDRTMDVHIRKLREKIGKKHLKTVKGVGYKFSLDDE